MRGISKPSLFCILGCLALLAIGCGKKDDSASATSSAKAKPKSFDPMAVELSDPKLIEGRTVWMATCSKCHLTGLGGAPKIGDVADWAPRIAKGQETLYTHAIEGFTSPTYNVMPPKGGFIDLSDGDVKLAVDFVTFASK